MGTNYRMTRQLCEHCGNTQELHIGKASAGWVFALRVYPDNPLLPHDLNDWRKLWNRDGVIITTEYGERILPDEMDRRVAERREYGLRRHTHLGGLPVSSYDLVDLEFS